MSQIAGVAKEVVPAQTGFGAWLRRAGPATFVIGLMAGLAYWGHATEWEFGLHGSGGDHDEQQSTPPLATLRLSPNAEGKAQALPGLQKQVSLVFPFAEATEKAGIDVAPVWTSAMTETIAGSGELSFDPNRVARLSTRANGTVWRVLKKVGAQVQAGEVVALVDAAEVGKAKSELEQWIVQVRLRQKAIADLRAAGSAVKQQQQKEAEASLRDADVKLLSAEQTLVNLGLPVKAAEFSSLSLDEIVERLRGLGLPANIGFDSTRGTANLLPVRSPFVGVVFSVDVVAGEVIDTSRTVMVINDPKQLWLTLHIAQDSAKRVQQNQLTKFRPDGQTEEVESRVSWIGTAADEVTRTVPIRTFVSNEKGTLRASTLGQGRIVVRESPNAVVVPRGAVQTFRGASIVFVRHPDYLKADGPKEFAVRAVTTGTSDGTNKEILSGLAPSDIVASKGANVLLAELGRLLQVSAGAQRDPEIGKASAP